MNERPEYQRIPREDLEERFRKVGEVIGAAIELAEERDCLCPVCSLLRDFGRELARDGVDG